MRVTSIEPEIHIAFCASSNLFRYVATAINSIASSNLGAKIYIHLVTCDRNELEEAKLSRSISKFDLVSMEILHLSEKLVNGFFVDRHISKETYLRVFIPDLVPDYIDRILYLDCDIIIVENLLPLWNSDMDGRSIAAAPDVLLELFDGVPRGVLGLSDSETYVNAGVLLIDLRAWRKKNLTARLVRYVVDRGSSLTYHDQDAINAVARGDIKLVSCRWNLPVGVFRLTDAQLAQDTHRIREARRNPAVLHYTGPSKPWMFRSSIPKKGYYFRHAERTEWLGSSPEGLSFFEKMEYWLDKKASFFGVDYLRVVSLFTRLFWRLSDTPLLLCRKERRAPATVLPRTDRSAANSDMSAGNGGGL